MTARPPDPAAEAAAEALGPAWRGVDAVAVLGSGLGAAADRLEVEARVAAGDLPGWGGGSVPGHRGRLVLARTAGRRVAVFDGRRHLYEGAPPAEVALPARLAAALGAGVLVLLSAVGGVDPALGVGDWVFVTDHLNWMGRNPLEGVVTPDGPPFVDLSRTYRTDLLDSVRARAPGVRVEPGVLAAFTGPTYETPAEVRWAAAAGAAAVGMSTVPEAVWARFLDVDVVALGRVANPAAGLCQAPLDHASVVAEGRRGAADAAALLEAAVAAWAEGQG